MNLYAFELGREKDLCFAELEAMFGPCVERCSETAIFSMDEVQNPQKLQDSLGGTIKIIKIIEEGHSLKRSIENLLKEEFTDASGKIPFSISVLNYKNNREIDIKGLLNFSKKVMKSLGLNSRFVNKNFQNTRPSTIFKAKVIQKGIDINVLKTHSTQYIGKTVSIQNIDSYSKRDFSKPKRDAKVGMLPPKLAQIMINLAGPDTKRIYDPFCGTGTVLTESMLMGKDAIGSDLESTLVKYSEENCNWLAQQYNTQQSVRVFTRDARFINKEVVPEKIDAIVTEGYLGEPLRFKPYPKRQEEIFRELANLHLNWLRAATSLTDKVVMCVTALRSEEGVVHFPRFEELADTAGWGIASKHLYGRDDQIVLRDIMVLEKY
ncbi:hypothetical protein JKY72_05050 [Candidatus Gracilibacteria bacterium]|nr:hypothetical protein [Candidatus Gracilibacteria bacterium]